MMNVFIEMLGGVETTKPGLSSSVGTAVGGVYSPTMSSLPCLSAATIASALS